MARYAYQRFATHTPPELASAGQPRYPVAIVGAGPVGLAAAIDPAGESAQQPRHLLQEGGPADA